MKSWTNNNRLKAMDFEDAGLVISSKCLESGNEWPEPQHDCLNKRAFETQQAQPAAPHVHRPRRVGADNDGDRGGRQWVHRSLLEPSFFHILPSVKLLAPGWVGAPGPTELETSRPKERYRQYSVPAPLNTRRPLSSRAIDRSGRPSGRLTTGFELVGPARARAKTGGPSHVSG